MSNHAYRRVQLGINSTRDVWKFCHIGLAPATPNDYLFIMVIAKEDGREVGFQDGAYFSRLLKRKKINKHALLAIVNHTLNLD